MNGIKFLIVESSLLPILIPLGPKYSHQKILFSNIHILHSSLNIRDLVSQPYRTTSNIIGLYNLIFKFLERSLEDKSVWNE
jgi:hypothetical protein